MNFETAVAARFRREYKQIEVLWKAKTRKCFLVLRASERQHKCPEILVLTLTRLRERCEENLASDVRSEKGRLHPREFYEQTHVIFSDANIQRY